MFPYLGSRRSAGSRLPHSTIHPTFSTFLPAWGHFIALAAVRETWLARTGQRSRIRRARHGHGSRRGMAISHHAGTVEPEFRAVPRAESIFILIWLGNERPNVSNRRLYMN
eukprot:scaffold5893_cov100-Isochrysis_galbana.AAC.2